MKNNLLCIILFLLGLELSFCQKISDEGLQLYWEKMEKIENGISLSSNEFDEIWSSIGYDSWRNTYGYQDIINNYFNLIYNPKSKELLEKKLNRNKSVSLQIIEHLYQAKNQKLELRKYLENLDKTKLILESKSLASKYLPKSLNQLKDSTLIAFILITPESEVITKDNIVLIDLLTAYRLKNDLVKLLAHELHHLYTLKHFSQLKNINNSKLIYNISKLQLEGIANLIDKNEILSRKDKDEYEKTFCEFYRESKSRLKKIDILIQEIADDESMLHNNGQKIEEELPLGGHPNGLYMAHLIKRVFGEKGIIECIENPFTFIKLYNKAAKKFPKEYYIFSDKSITYLENLEKQWIEKN